MGIAIESYKDTPEEQEEQKRKATKKRITTLFVVLVVAVGARLLIKNPEPPKAPDHSDQPMRYLPGVLDTLPASEIANLDPDTLARLRAADANALAKKKKTVAIAKTTPYVPQERPPENLADKEAYKTYLVKMQKKRKLREELQQRLARDLTKNMLVQFRGGGYLKVENAEPRVNGVDIQFDKTVMAHVSKRLVKKISHGAVDWEEPVPKGFVKLKPARGMTIVIAKRTSKRISLRKYEDYES